MRTYLWYIELVGQALLSLLATLIYGVCLLCLLVLGLLVLAQLGSGVASNVLDFMLIPLIG